MKRNVILGIGLILVCAVVAMGSMKGSTVSSVKFAELAKTKGEACQVYGRLDSSSIKMLEGLKLVRFALIEEGTGQRLNVLYDNPNSALPANFPAASHAKVTGTYDAASRLFTGASVLTKCPSKYDGKTDLGLKNEAGALRTGPPPATK